MNKEGNLLRGPVGRMAVVVCITLALSVMAAWLLSQETAEGTYEAALLKKEAEGDLQGAIQLFQKILKTYPDKREVAAKALLQIGLCYEKLGNDEATKAYETILKNYTDRPDEVAAARERLTAIRQGTSADPSVIKVPNVETNYYPNCLSPDGTKLLGYEEEETGTNIVYLDIPSGKTVPITHFDLGEESFWADSPIWSPDGKEIAYQVSPNNPKVYQSELTVRPIDGDSRVLFGTKDGMIWPCDWLKDGSAIVAAWWRQDKSLSLGLIPLSGGTFKTLSSVQKDLPLPNPRVSPDGRFLVFEEGGVNAGNIRIISLDGTLSSLLVDHPADDKEALWSPDGKFVAFLSTRLGSWALWAVAVKDGKAAGQPFMVKDDMNDTTLLNWTAQGLACQKWIESDDIFIQSIDPQTNTLIGKPEILAYSPTGKNAGPRWSPDGKSLAFITRAPGPPAAVKLVVRRQEDGKTSEYTPPLARTFSFVDYLTWLPDGSGLIFASALTGSPGGPLAFYKLDFASSRWNSLALPGPGFYISCGPDNTSIYYGLNDSKEFEGGIIKRNLITEAENRIYGSVGSSVGTFHGLGFSRDFRRLAFVIWSTSESGKFLCQIQILELESGLARVAYSGSDLAGSLSWSPDDRYFLVWCADKSGWQKDIALVPVEGGPIKKLNVDLSWPEGAGVYNRFTSLDWSPDGTKIALGVWSSIEDSYILKNVIPEGRRK